MLELDIQHQHAGDVPGDDALWGAVRAALLVAGADGGSRELTLRIVDRQEMRDLNARYRHRDYATNVLSFPADLPAHITLPLLGDVVVCAPVVDEEARDQGKARQAHWDHMLVHGVLHLLGFDHEAQDDAQVMEDLERKALATLGWPDPYTLPLADACA